MNPKTLNNFTNWLSLIEDNSSVQYQLDIASTYRLYLSEHNNHFTLEMYRKVKQITYLLRKELNL